MRALKAITEEVVRKDGWKHNLKWKVSAHFLVVGNTGATFLLLEYLKSGCAIFVKMLLFKYNY